jgi:hypothetical protein
MATGDQDPVRATALMHYAGIKGAATAILLVQIRPHAVAPAAQAEPFAVALLEQLRGAGWAAPTPMFSGEPVDLPAVVLVEGATATGSVTITAAGEVLYEGPVHRPPGWAPLIEATGVVMVLVGADRSLDDAGVRGDLAGLVDAGRVVAAYGRTLADR